MRGKHRRTTVCAGPANRHSSLPPGDRGRARSRRRIAYLVLLACAAAGIVAFGEYGQVRSQERESSCITCHSQLEARLSEPVKHFNEDIHKAKGLSCTDCHGGDSTKAEAAAAMDPWKGYVGKVSPREIPAFCGKCHSDPTLMRRFNPSLRVDQVQEYFTSVHGIRLRSGDTKVATCVSCHGVHGIRAPADSQSRVYALNVAETCAGCHANAEHMAGYPIPNDQFAKYRASVHATALYDKQDLSAPTCNDCHGNHGAAPPGLTSVANVCGQCHGRQAELFQKSPHRSAFQAMNLGECIRCHSNHDVLSPTDEMVGVGEGSSCTSCHANDAGYAAAVRISDGLSSIRRSIADASEILERAERAGMEVSKPQFELRDASDSLIQARVLVHTASPDDVEAALAPGKEIAEKSFLKGEEAFMELAYRRKGLIVSLFFILILASLIYLKIRQIENRPPFASETDAAPLP